MSMINLTPHAITIIGGPTIPPSGSVARVATTSTPVGLTDGIETCVTAFGQVTGLPAPQDGVFLIVSGMVLDASRRADLRAPGELVRGPDGQPMGCRGLRAA